MNFSGEDRKQVFFFFEEILKSYREPVYYENLRGHVSKAPVNVRKYVLAKCRGDNFLEYFTRRKNYFHVEGGKISLKDEFSEEHQGNSHSSKSKKKSSKGKFVRRNASFSHSSYASALKGGHSNKNGEKEYETIAITYFRNRLIRKKKERLWAIEVNDLPKKVKRHLQLYYRSKVKGFLSDYPDKFAIDSDDETVSLVHVSESTDTVDSSAVDNESSETSNQNPDSIAADSEIQKASEYLECVLFFIHILNKSQPLLVDKLGGYFSQARKEIKDHINANYRSFKYFFDDAPLIFLKNASDEIYLSKEYKKLIKAAENLIKGAINGLTLPPEMPLKSHIIHIFRPLISSRRSSSILEEEDINNEVLPFEDMADAHEGLAEEMWKVQYIDRRESEMSCASTDEFFDNYLMRSTSRESSISLSSRSTRSISVERSQVESFSTIKNMEKSGSDIAPGFDDKEIMENTFLKCVLTVELFCLEFMESELNFIQKYESKAVKYFMEILDASSTKLWRLTQLQGSIGNDREVALFMNKLYKGDKFVSFFEKHPQFEVDPPFVKVALVDKTNSTEESASFSNEENGMKDLKDLYEINEFRVLLKETYEYLHDVCEFCKDKDDVKIDRVSGILPRFPSCFSMIKSSDGQSLSEKVEHFLRETMIFQFPKKGILFFSYEIFHEKCQILFAWFEKMNHYDPSLEFISFSDFWTMNVYSGSGLNKSRKRSRSYINLEECYRNVVDMIEEKIESRSELSYHDLPKIIPEYVLFSLTNGSYYSRPLISALLESGNFRVKDGKISFQKTSEDHNSVPSDNKDNEPTENLSELENPISEECSDELSIPQNVSNNNLVSGSSSPSVNSKDISNLSEESKAELCSNHSPKMLQTTEYDETKEADSRSVESKPDSSFKDDKMSIDLPSINHGQNETHIYETIKESFVLEENERHTNVLNTEENLSSDTAQTGPENLNPAEERAVCTKTSKSVLSSKTKDLVEKEYEYVDEISNECCRCEDEINSKTDSSLPNSDVLEDLSILPVLTPPPKFCEFEEYSKENQNLSSVSDGTSLLTSKDLSEQENEFVSDQILPSPDLNLNKNYIAPQEEKSLDKDSLTKPNSELEVSNENGAESSIKTSKEEQNISLSEDEKLSKLKNDLLNNQCSDDKVDAETEMTKEQQLHNSELPNKDTNIRISAQSTVKNRNLDNRKASEQINEESFQNGISRASDFSDTPAQTRISVPVPGFKEIQELQVTSKNTNVSLKHSFTHTPEELFDTSLMKLYMNSEERTPTHDLESEEKNSAKKVTCGSSSPMLTTSHEGKSEITVSRASSCNDLSSEYPMQPIMAKVVLLTNSSCIALADMQKCKKNIYFLKCAFACEHQDDCSDCFSALRIGDEVSCFVPLTEISQKIWIAFMVTKDNSDNLSEFGIFDKLKENAKAMREGSTKSRSISAQIKIPAHDLGCQTELFSKIDNYSQTELNGDVDLYKVTKETSCQTWSVSVKSVFVQTEDLTKTCITETGSRNGEIPLMYSRKCAKCQIYLNGDFEKDVMSENATCRDSWLGKITGLTKNVGCQTFSTGQIMMLKHHPM